MINWLNKFELMCYLIMGIFFAVSMLYFVVFDFSGEGWQ